ncbi:MAG: hypothetical protein E7577_02565 [Ruminococcaceae bacterium]|nr:hypothetical protein [Oscillospiraceae bacterium]
MKKYIAPEYVVIAMSRDEIMVGIDHGSYNVAFGPGDDIYSPSISSGGTGSLPIGGGLGGI